MSVISTLPALKQPPAEDAQCSSFPADAYDRYVLGLLDSKQRADLEHHVQMQCPACIRGLQRSMNLWLTFAAPLEQAKPAADLRARLVRLAELSNGLLVAPRQPTRVGEPAFLVSTVIVICLIMAALLVVSWQAGKQSAQLDQQNTSNKLQRNLAELIRNQASLTLQSAGKSRESPEAAKAQAYLQQELNKARAEAEQFRQHLKNGQQAADQSAIMLDALASPNTRLMALKNANGDPLNANAFVIDSARVLLIASRLPKPSEGRQYELWIVRKDMAAPVSARLFTASGEDKTFITYDDDKESVNNLAGLFVTEEPMEGSKEPSGKRILETAAAAPPEL